MLYNDIEKAYLFSSFYIKFIFFISRPLLLFILTLI